MRPVREPYARRAFNRLQPAACVQILRGPFALRRHTKAAGTS
jgi:hypothetical protein